MLEVAAAAFTSEGTSVSLDEIARRAGVGAGTVHRHFPTKEALLQAVISERLERLVLDARALADASDPGDAFYRVFSYLVTEGAASHALAAGLAEAGVDYRATSAAPMQDLKDAIATLLVRAQRAGAVRKDIDASDLHALLAGAHAIDRHPAGGKKGVAILCDGLRPPGSRSR